MKYIATFYSHFGAIRFKREAPEGVTQYRTTSCTGILVRPVERVLPFRLMKVLLSREDPYRGN